VGPCQPGRYSGPNCESVNLVCAVALSAIGRSSTGMPAQQRKAAAVQHLGDQGDEMLAEIGRSYNVSTWTFPKIN
jgi:hypothetical protein